MVVVVGWAKTWTWTPEVTQSRDRAWVGWHACFDIYSSSTWEVAQSSDNGYSMAAHLATHTKRTGSGPALQGGSLCGEADGGSDWTWGVKGTRTTDCPSGQLQVHTQVACEASPCSWHELQPRMGPPYLSILPLRGKGPSLSSSIS